ncbi:MAG: NAD(+)/NADH kinase [Elusimicrobiaceae bacterium]|nr:NAD(+)/NADH kinase [Elusimicrobiaceae bacterium]
MDLKHVSIFVNKPHNHSLAQQAADFLRAHKVKVEFLNSPEELSSADMLLSFGGDGTLLQCARHAAPKNIPVFGINCGTLGFLASCEKEAVIPSLEQMLKGSFTLHRRSLLQAQVTQPQQEKKIFLAFNDCVLHAATPRAFILQAQWNQTQMPSYYGDGVVVSTPTGSTAYSLAAGGPIVEPSVDVLVVTPICPHSLHQRPIVLPASGTLTLTPSLKYKEDTVLLSLDGQTHLSLSAGGQVEITRSTYTVQLVGLPGRDFFTNLHRKLSWGNLEC